ncbi:MULTISPECIES: hypothetical protein [Serratia]|uniref:hypothetical protein n=1 Tax=Serratia TaxID=613 RepID=UPI00066990A0|nr:MULTISPECIES: hypothetical protein [Serratia]EIJ7464154.1 hypothetical protein [Serratia marcescens]EJA2552337.1 hypothetical protein [Serratia marcescens]EJA2596983.1 hypothetical protein [Serratia marcescens]MBH2623794.1 hypothetical protein [Serratia marcescens]MBH2771946.1 hypothetical protein [Serratia marcescens]
MNRQTANTRMPLNIPEAGFNTKLNVTGNNIEHTTAFMQKGVVDFSLPGYTTPHGYRLVKARTEDHYRLVTDSQDPVTVYAVRLEFMENIVPGRRSCTQIMVWRSVQPQYTSAVTGLPRMFFQYFLESHSIVVSDSEQTSDGRRFWEGMIAWAIQADGYHVYVSDGTEEDRPLTFMTSWDDFYGTWTDFCWGDDRDCHSHRLLVISKDQLH